jgi:hypothetical protein
MRTRWHVVILALSCSTLSWAESPRKEKAEWESSTTGTLLDASSHRRPQQLSVFLGLPWYRGFGGVFPGGIGGRFYFPLLHDGFLPGVNDSLGLEVGADLSFYAYWRNAPLGLSLAVPFEAMWQLHVLPRLAAYLKLGVALDFGFANTCSPNGYCGPNGYIWPFVVATGGLAVQLTQAIALRLEVGYPWLRLGLGFAL